MSQLTIRKSKGAKKSLKSIEVEKGESGGHIATHHFSSEGGQFHEPEKHAFGDDQGTELLAHVAHHMAVKPSEDPEEPEGEEGGDSEGGY